MLTTIEEKDEALLKVRGLSDRELVILAMACLVTLRTFPDHAPEDR